MQTSSTKSLKKTQLAEW